MTRPNFFIIGNPKCGTTSLASWLQRNREIFLSADKEPHFFATDMADRAYQRRSEYNALFAEADAPIIGEASVWYAYSQEAIPNILKECPCAKFVLCLRNPTDMAWALHNQMIQVGNETVTDFHDAWALISERRAGREVPSFCLDPRKLDYEHACRQGEILSRLYSHVDRRQVHLVFLEDMASDPAGVVSGIEDFLGVVPSEIADFPVENGAFERRSSTLNRAVKLLGRIKGRLIKRRLNTGLLTRLDLANRTKSRRQPMPAETRRLLTETFRNDVEMLEQLTERDLSHWKALSDD